MPEVKDDLLDVLNELHAEIFNAWNNTGAGEQRALLNRILTALGAAIEKLTLADFSSRDAAYTAAITSIDAANAELKKLKEQINKIIDSVEIAARVAGLIAKALQLATQLPVP